MLSRSGFIVPVALELAVPMLARMELLSFNPAVQTVRAYFSDSRNGSLVFGAQLRTCFC